MTAAERILLRVLAIAIGVLLLVYGAIHVYSTYRTATANAETATELDETATITGDLSKDFTKKQVQRTELEGRVGSARETYIQRYEEVSRESDVVGSFNAVPVPVELRQLACERRRARDRPGDAPTRCPLDDGAAPDSG